MDNIVAVQKKGLSKSVNVGKSDSASLTWHHETVLQRRQEVRVRFSVDQILLDQLKHLAGTFSFYMDLRGCSKRFAFSDFS